VKLVLVAVPAAMAVQHVMVGVSVICLECLAATPWGPRQQSVWPFVTSASTAIGIYLTQLTSEWRDEGLLPRHPPPPTRCSRGGVLASFLLPLHSSTLCRLLMCGCWLVACCLLATGLFLYHGCWLVAGWLLPCGFSSCTLGVGSVIVGVSKCGYLVVPCLLLACCLLACRRFQSRKEVQERMKDFLVQHLPSWPPKHILLLRTTLHDAPFKIRSGDVFIRQISGVVCEVREGVATGCATCACVG
jgi:hypothetical protein